MTAVQQVFFDPELCAEIEAVLHATASMDLHADDARRATQVADRFAAPRS